MSRHPEYAIFGEFRELNLLNLLYYQAELTELESKFKIQARADRESQDSQRLLFGKHWGLLGDPHSDSEQWKIALQVREKLKEYRMFWISRLVVTRN